VNYALGVLAAILLGTSFVLQQGAVPLHVSLLPITAAEPVCAMVPGIVAFREKVPVSPAMTALRGAGLVTLVAGVVLVARAPSLGALHHAPHGQRTRTTRGGGLPARVSMRPAREDGPGSNRQGYRSSGREDKS
jgi:hypothetical protein